MRTYLHPKTWVLCAGFMLITGRMVALPEGYEERYHNDMRYGLFVPPSYDSLQVYPLVMYLHGCNDTTSYDHHWYSDSMQSAYPCFVLTPKGLNMVDWCDAWGHSWFPDHTPDMLNVLEIIDSLEKEFSIDTNRMHVYGISMGGFGTFDLLAKQPDMFASAIAMCSGGNPLTAAEVAKTPLWIFHGDADPLVDVERSRIMYKAITQLGGTQVRYTEYPGVDHDVWRPALAEPSFSDWLLAHERGVNHDLPDAPENLITWLDENGYVALSWDPPPDPADPDKRIWYYKLCRNDTLIAEIDGTLTECIDSVKQLAPSTSYQLSAVNYFFGESVMTVQAAPDDLHDLKEGDEPRLLIWPNPAEDEVRIQYTLDKADQVVLLIHNLQGKLIDIPVSCRHEKGTYRIRWQAAPYGGGNFFCSLMVGGRVYCGEVVVWGGY